MEISNLPDKEFKKKKKKKKTKRMFIITGKIRSLGQEFYLDSVGWASQGLPFDSFPYYIPGHLIPMFLQILYFHM